MIESLANGHAAFVLGLAAGFMAALFVSLAYVTYVVGETKKAMLLMVKKYDLLWPEETARTGSPDIFP
jgi:hypothetical protein